MDDDSIRIDPPLYLAHTKISCWRCRAKMPALALVAPNVAEADGAICILSEIKELPTVVLQFVGKRFPSFTLRYSKAVSSRYYANTCLTCGVISGDFYLHSEPGAPFFPTTKAEAEQLTLEPVPLVGPITVRAGVGIGAGDLILKHARKPTLTQPALTRAGKAGRR
jgi:hypothetical protein